ncbi:MAG: hypothetical protein HWN66_20290 [Candidatus Helarchaeota archaeon]|nr:hypothetical protein [Candidatus Helarchaeota archaeon]
MNTFSNIIIPTTVKKEVLFDSEKYSEANTIKKNFESKKLTEKKIQIKKITKNLGQGESEAISLADEEESLLITDDKLALNLAINRGVQVKTTETLLLILLKKKNLDFLTFIEKMNDLNKVKMLKPEIFQLILKEAEKYK